MLVICHQNYLPEAGVMQMAGYDYSFPGRASTVPLPIWIVYIHISLFGSPLSHLYEF